MKILFTFLLLIPLIAKAQNAPKGAEAIILKTSVSDSVLFEKTVRHLMANDYVIDKSDIKYGSIITQYKPIRGVFNLRVVVFLKSGVATFKGQWSAQMMGYSFSNEPVRNKGMAGSNEKKSFTQLNDLVISLSKEIEGVIIDYQMPEKK